MSIFLCREALCNGGIRGAPPVIGRGVVILSAAVLLPFSAVHALSLDRESICAGVSEEECGRRMSETYHQICLGMPSIGGCKPSYICLHRQAYPKCRKLYSGDAFMNPVPGGWEMGGPGWTWSIAGCFEEHPEILEDGMENLDLSRCEGRWPITIFE